MSREHSQACFDIYSQGCVCGIDNLEARAREMAPQMLAMLRKLEWSGTPEGGGRRGCCPECDEPSPKHYAGCDLDTLLKALP